MEKAARKSSGGGEPEKPGLQVREVANAAQRDKILEFRNRIMVEEMGIDPNSMDEGEQRDHAARDASARHLFLTSGKSIAGCLRSYTADLIAPSKDMKDVYELEAFSVFQPSFLSFTDHMVIGSRWRGSQAPALLTAAAFKLARGLGAHFDFTYCPPALVGLYEKIGYRCYNGRYLDAGEGLQVPMVLVMDDVAHLKSINSPFAPLAMLKPPDQNFVNWFAGQFPESVGYKVKALRDEQNMWEYLTRQLHQNPLHGVPLFEELTYDEARRFLRNATTLVLRGGDRLARAGDMGKEAFVMLSGTVEIRDRNGLVMARFSKGAVVGEIAYLAATPRTADMVVTSDAEVLILTPDMFRKTMQKEPGIASKVLLNLTLILAERLTATSAQLSANTQGF
ncbi:MAG: cyclic nucleotide-binding domain-containing protein [Rhodospirillaceae bacterium]|mgnify:FL=1|jgi:CRP-like cAMP-binding protein|nr:cyclic nucleotide-binding domain-containing protein [Rhodospirillaceae bacterium]MBT5192867.1 cyclic nucleotide-binding domain-containing protein [Rhodospirillaceae bacterium]MBT5896428.1 cyclic nucleotide-binding domain-containing protein [Rhodospirillaceae bacterium]MBT6426076.1 cyclic nucleotide-binding domain-containing protein [Rhodospirillaceae bacterium]